MKRALWLIGIAPLLSLPLAASTVPTQSERLLQAEADCDLGNKLLRGRGVASDIEGGKALIKASAEQGFAQCQYYLGLMYKDGRWFGFNPVEALSWLHKAARQGLAGAQTEMGLACEQGLGDFKAPNEALDWYRQAALQQHKTAMYHYGRLLVALPDQAIEGRAWLKLAADLGDYDAQTLLSKLEPLTEAQQQPYAQQLGQLSSQLKPAVPAP